MRARFGTAGESDSFHARGYRTGAQIPQYLREFELDAFEYQCGRGVRLSESTAAAIRAAAAAQGIVYSLHAPYYISMSSLEEDKRLKSVDYILQSARAVDMLGGKRVVIHTGSCGKQSREAALEKALDTMRLARAAVDEAGLSHIILCPETMGKVGQLGTLEEVLALCRLDERILPCIDFGHLNARTQGGLAAKQQMAALLDRMADVLQDGRASAFHAHFSMIEYTAGGEKRHLTFDTGRSFGPDFEPLMELLYQRGLCPTIICESAGTQAEDAAAMKRYYCGQFDAGEGKKA